MEKRIIENIGTEKITEDLIGEIMQIKDIHFGDIVLEHLDKRDLEIYKKYKEAMKKISLSDNYDEQIKIIEAMELEIKNYHNELDDKFNGNFDNLIYRSKSTFLSYLENMLMAKRGYLESQHKHKK